MPKHTWTRQTITIANNRQYDSNEKSAYVSKSAPGLGIYRSHYGTWVVVHVKSGKGMSIEARTLVQAKDAAVNLSMLFDWDREETAVVAEAFTHMERVRAIGAEARAELPSSLGGTRFLRRRAVA